jgi:hypothetical protein
MNQALDFADTASALPQMLLSTTRLGGGQLGFAVGHQGFLIETVRESCS